MSDPATPLEELDKANRNLLVLMQAVQTRAGTQRSLTQQQLEKAAANIAKACHLQNIPTPHTTDSLPSFTMRQLLTAMAEAAASREKAATTPDLSRYPESLRVAPPLLDIVGRARLAQNRAIYDLTNSTFL